MSPLDALFLGVIEGITEFLPISSTGHLILGSALLGVANSDFTKSFEIIIQLGAILAVVVLYVRSFFDLEVLKRLIVAFIPTGIIGLLLYHFIKTYLLGNEAVVLWSLLIGGAILIGFELWHKEREDASDDVRSITYTQAFLIGLFQSIAVIPGVSRSAATILGGLGLGIKRVAIVEFSFLLAVPTMAAATGLDVVKNISLFKSAGNFTELAIGFIVSFVVALVAIKWLLGYVRKHSFISFGVYRIAVALLFFIIVLR
jgi:undecaprenyl-diphosphatase